MSFSDPLSKSKEEYSKTIDIIKSTGTVGIDAQYTHAIIVEYLQQISQRLDALEEKVSRIQQSS